MYVWTRYLAAVILLSPAVSAAQQPVYTFTPESLLDNQCIDTPPIGDGFGWDGICTCIANPADISYEWVPNPTLLDGQLIASTVNAPGTCSESGSISIYDWRGDQPPLKTQELIPSVRNSRDRFGLNVFVTNGLIASRSSVSESFVTIFRRTGELWAEEIILNPVGINRGGFGVLMRFLDEQTLLIDEDDALIIYDAADWLSPQVIPIEAQNLATVDGGFVVTRAASNSAISAQTDYFVRDGTQYRIQQTLDNTFTAVSDNLMVTRIGETLITRELNSSGMWVELAAATIDIEFIRFITTVKLVDNQLVITNEDNLQIFTLSNSQTWELSQQFDVEDVEGPCGFGRCKNISTSIDDGKIVLREFDTRFDIIPVSHTIYERDDNGVWAVVSTVTLVDSEDDTIFSSFSFAPNRHFSLIENFALAEIPNGPRDRSTLEVFDLTTDQPTAEEPGDESSDTDNNVANGEDSSEEVIAVVDTSDTDPGVVDSDATDGSTVVDSEVEDIVIANEDSDTDASNEETNSSDTETNADDDITNVASDSGGGVIGPLTLLLIMLHCYVRRSQLRWQAGE